MNKKFEIIPAILEKKISEIEKKIKQVNNLVNTIQIDICDGYFVPSKTIASSGCKNSFLKLKQLTKKINLELDLMIDLDSKINGRTEKWFKSIKEANPSRLIFHFSSTKDWDKIFNFIKKYKMNKIEIGLAIKIQEKDTNYQKIFKKYPFSFIQFMGIEKIGYGGQNFSFKVFKKIENFRKNNPKIPISVDGGVKIENTKKLKSSGATRLVSGSGIFKAKDKKKIIEEFKKI